MDATFLKPSRVIELAACTNSEITKLQECVWLLHISRVENHMWHQVLVRGHDARCCGGGDLAHAIWRDGSTWYVSWVQYLHVFCRLFPWRHDIQLHCLTLVLLNLLLKQLVMGPLADLLRQAPRLKHSRYPCPHCVTTGGLRRCVGHRLELAAVVVPDVATFLVMRASCLCSSQAYLEVVEL